MNPSTDKTRLLRELTPKSYHFDGYNVVNNTSIVVTPRPFFSTNNISFGKFRLQIAHDTHSNTLGLFFEDVCPFPRIIFKTYRLTFEEFAEKIKTAVTNSCDLISFDIKVEYKNKPACWLKCDSRNSCCENLLEKKPSSVMAAVSFDFKAMQEAISAYFGINITPIKNFGGSTMETTRKNNKLFGLNFEFGPSRDTHIASTLLGIAVLNPANGNWYTFENGVRKNYNKLKFGNLPLMLLPIKEPAVGDLLKIDGTYYYVREIKPDTISLIGAVDGIIREMIPDESFIPGFKFYTKVVALINKTGLRDMTNNDVSGNMLAAMLMMQWANGDKGATFSMDNITDDSFNGLGSYLPLMLASGNSGALGNIFGGLDGNTALPMLMAMNGGNSTDEFTQMMILSQLMGNNKTANPLTNIINPVVESATSEEVVCTGCGEIYPDDSIKFCPICGKPTRLKANTCPSCNTVLKSGASFCHNCGIEIGKATYCKNCGKELTADENFCSTCGAPTSSNPVTSKKPTRRKKSVAKETTPSVPAVTEPEKSEETTEK